MELISRHICKTQNMGVHGNLFGGDMLAWLDEAGAMYARMKANSGSMVTVRVGDHSFDNPVKQGEQVEIFGEVIKRGTTSIELHLTAEKIELKTGKRIEVTNTRMIFVRIDEDGNSRPIDWPDPVSVDEDIKKEKPVEFKLNIPDNSQNIPEVTEEEE